MKFLLATAVVSSALVASFADAEPCSIPQLTTIMSNEFTMPCMTGSGLDFTKLNGAPTQAQLTRFCKTSACTSFLKAVMAQNPPDCTLPTGNLQFRSQLFGPIEAFCSSVSNGGAAGNASAVTSNDTGNATSHSNATTHSNTTMPASNTTMPVSNTTIPATNNNTTITKPDTIVVDNGAASSTVDSQKEGSENSMSAANSDTEPATSTTTTAPAPSTTESAAGSSFAVSACASALGVTTLLWVL